MDNDWMIFKALDSYTSLCDVVNDLSEEQLTKALDIEASTQRRATVLDRLIARLVRINELRLVQKLKVKYART